MSLKGNNPECQNYQALVKSVFCDLDSEELYVLNLHNESNTFKKGQRIFNEGRFPYGLFYVNNGKIKISQLGSEGKEQIVHLAKEGDILGYSALLSGSKYSVSATTLDDSSICFIPKDVFFSLVEKNSNLSKEMLKLLSHDLKEAEYKITSLAQKPIKERLAEALLLLKKVYGFECDGATINVTLSREEIASMVGTSTETISRLLSEFKQDKMIGFVGKKIKFLNTNQIIRTSSICD